MQARKINLTGRKAERGGVLVAVLIIATVFAILAYVTLQVSLHSLEATDTHSHMYSSRLVAEGGIEYASAMLREDFGAGDDSTPFWLDPYQYSGTTEDLLRKEFVSADFSTVRELDTFPFTYERTAYTTSTSFSTYSPDTDLVPGSRDEAAYRYHDDYAFSEDYPAYEFAPVQSTGDLVVYGTGEVVEPEGDLTLFSFLQGRFPNVEWNYDVRETGVTEPSRIGPYPYIQTQHPYKTNQSRAWVVTYQEDPLHSGRNITDIRLMADLNQVQISDGDWLYISGWIENYKRFQGINPGDPPELQIPSYHRLTDYINDVSEVFSQKLPSTSIALFLMSDGFPPEPGKDYGFRVSGVRYSFDSDEGPCYYETPHPYDDIVPGSSPLTPNIQVIYSPYQARPTDPEFFSQRMKIQFDEQFSLDTGDVLFIFNASEPTSPLPLASYSDFLPLPSDGYAPEISRNPLSPDLPLGYVLLLYRANPGDADGIKDYGYKVRGLEYTDLYGDYIRIEDPIMESPHSRYLGPNDTPYYFPSVPPLPGYPAAGYAGYQTIYRPFCPNTDALDGIGTVDNWWVAFTDGCNLTASSGATNTDFIRLTTPGSYLLEGMYETIYFAHPDGALSWEVENLGNYLDIELLNEYLAQCGAAELLEIEFHSDNVDEYEDGMDNFGYRIAEVGYYTSDGADDDRTPPTIRSDVNFPLNEGYPAFGTGTLEYSEWWYTNEDALLVGLHFDRYHFAIDPGDRIEIYDEAGLLIATLVSESVSGGPGSGSPDNPDLPEGGEQGGHGPGAGGPYLPEGTVTETVVDLNETYGWVLVPGTTAQLKLVGDGDDNEGYSGFEIDHCGYVNGDLTEIRDYAEEYARVAYDIYYDRSSEAMEAFRTLGMD